MEISKQDKRDKPLKVPNSSQVVGIKINPVINEIRDILVRSDKAMRFCELVEASDTFRNLNSRAQHMVLDEGVRLDRFNRKGLKYHSQ